jgi:hypothetical protein
VTVLLLLFCYFELLRYKKIKLSNIQWATLKYTLLGCEAILGGRYREKCHALFVNPIFII